MTSTAPAPSSGAAARGTHPRPHGAKPAPPTPIRHVRPPSRGAPAGLVSGRIVVATARRVLTQLLHDHRTIAILLGVPSVLLALIDAMYDSKPDFDRVAVLLIGIFPFIVMFVVASVAMVRERSSGTLERLLTTPMSKLDLLLGYGIGFGIAGAAEALVTCATAHWLLDLYTAGSWLLVLGLAAISATVGMATGLLASAFAKSDFEAVLLVIALVYPQGVVGGLFVPRTQMSGWLYTVSGALPLTYNIEALAEAGRTSLLTAKLIRDTSIMIGVILAALALAATTLRRRTGPLPRSTRRTLFTILIAVLVAGSVLATGYLLQTRWYISTENAQIDGDKIQISASADGTVTDWRAIAGASLRKNETIGHIQVQDRFVHLQQLVRAPADGTVAVSDIVDGTYVRAGTELATAYDMSKIFVTARVKETDIDDVRLGQQVDITVDAHPDATLSGYVRDIRPATAQTFSATPQNNTTGSFRKLTQVIPVRIAITGGTDLALVPGMNATVKIHKR